MKTNQLLMLSILLVTSYIFLGASNPSGISPFELITSDLILAMYLSFLIVAFLPNFYRKSLTTSQKEEVKLGTFY